MITVLREFFSLKDPPEGVLLQVSEEMVCKGANVIFNCSVADAHPMELTYHLYENNVIVSNNSSTGIWNRRMTTGGKLVYRCKVTNIIGTVTNRTASVTVTVNGKHGSFLTNNFRQFTEWFLDDPVFAQLFCWVRGGLKVKKKKQP